jgi:hypothetical protein
MQDIAEEIKRTVFKITRVGEHVGREVSRRLGVPFGIVDISLAPTSTPGDSVAEILELIGVERVGLPGTTVALAMLNDAVKKGGAMATSRAGGLSALVEKQASRIDEELMAALPEALAATTRVCASVNVATTAAGINLDAVRLMGEVIKDTAERTAGQSAIGCAKLVVFANAVPDNPFMAGAFHGFGEGDAAISVGISGPGVVANALRRLPPGAPMHDVAEEIKRTVFKITRVGEHVGREVARRLEVAFGVVDISLAPTSLPGDSVAEILELIGVERVGLPGTTVALAMLNDAVKKGGAMATSRAGGLSGAFIPVSEDAGFASAVDDGHLVLEKLEAMTAVCSVGLDMIALPGDTSAQTISAIIADEAAIGIINDKTTACRLIPVPGAQPGQWVDWGGLLGRAPVMEVRDRPVVGVVERAGHVPAPLRALGN